MFYIWKTTTSEKDDIIFKKSGDIFEKNVKISEKKTILSLMIGLLFISRMINQFKFISSSRLSRWTSNPCLLCPPAKPRRTNKLKLKKTIYLRKRKHMYLKKRQNI